MSSVSEVNVLSTSNKDVVKKSLLSDKYLKQMVFAYWLNQKSIENGTSLLETIHFFETVEIQRVFYDTFDDNYKSIKTTMMEEIKTKNKTTETKVEAGKEAEPKTEAEAEAGPEKGAKPTKPKKEAKEVKEAKPKKEAKEAKEVKPKKEAKEVKPKKEAKEVKPKKESEGANTIQSSEKVESTKNDEIVEKSDKESISDENTATTNEITVNDKLYLIDSNFTVYDINNHSEIGKFDKDRDEVILHV